MTAMTATVGDSSRGRHADFSPCIFQRSCNLFPKRSDPGCRAGNARRQKRAPPTTAPLLIRAARWGWGGGVYGKNSGRTRNGTGGLQRSSGECGMWFVQIYIVQSDWCRSPPPERLNNRAKKQEREQRVPLPTG